MAAMGLIIVAIADNQAATEGFHPNALFWAGTLLIFVPPAVRILTARTRTSETIALLVTLTLALYAVKILHSPTQFALHDEFLHWRTTDDILQTGRLFSDNPLLPTSARYPALEAATAFLADLGGVDIFRAGLVIIGVARVAFVVTLYFLLATASGSRRLGAAGAIVYAANPNFLFFNAAFNYEAIALAFAVACLYFAQEYTRASPEHRRSLWVAAALVGGAAAISHHLTAIALTGLLFLWSAVATWMSRRGAPPHRPAPWALTAVVGTMAIGWLLVAAPVTVAYLAPVFGGAVGQGFALIAQLLGVSDATPSARELFGGSQPGGPPPWERVVAIAAVGIAILASVWGAWALIRRRIRSPLMWALLIAVPAYPATLVLRLTPRGWETANRSSEFLFVGLAVPIAFALIVIAKRVRRRLGAALVVGAATALLVGGVVAGWSIDDRLPGPYRCCSPPRGVNAESLSMALWMRDTLPWFSRVGADPLDHLMIGSYGRQEATTTLSGGIDPNWVIFARTFDDQVRADLTAGMVRYIVVDDRVATNPEAFDEYIGDWTIADALAKFEDSDLPTVYDNGHIRVYDVSELWVGP